VREATRVPLATARMASEVLTLAERLAPIGTRHAISDVGVGALLAATAVRGASLNVEINLPSVAGDTELRIEAADGIASLRAGLERRERRVHELVAERMR
jgi:methenyltetrahydrofolate cyclohydrolase